MADLYTQQMQSQQDSATHDSATHDSALIGYDSNDTSGQYLMSTQEPQLSDHYRQVAPVTTTTTTNTRSYVQPRYFLYLFIGFALMILAGVGFYFVYTNRKPTASPPSSGPVESISADPFGLITTGQIASNGDVLNSISTSQWGRNDL